MPDSGLSLRDAPMSIEDYALIGNGKTAALVARDGAIDWLCLPRFDSAACFAAILGTADHGSWRIAPQRASPQVRRAYRGDTLVLETVFTTPEGEVAVIDAMPLDQAGSHIIRRVEGRRGQVAMGLHLKLRFGFGSASPWVTSEADGHGVLAIAGPDLVTLRGPVPLQGRALATVASFTVQAGQSLTFVMSHGVSHLPPPAPFDAEAALTATEESWRAWSAKCRGWPENSHGWAWSGVLMCHGGLRWRAWGGA